MMSRIYALYKGEELIATGTAEALAKLRGVKVNTILFYARPVYERRTNNGLRLVSLDDESDKKAYALTYDEPLEGPRTIIVWDETAGKAKAQGIYNEELGEPENFTDIQCRRCKWADEMEEAPEEELWTAAIRNGLTFMIDYDDFNSLVTDEDLPAIEKVGGLSKFCSLWLDGKVETAWQKE